MPDACGEEINNNSLVGVSRDLFLEYVPAWRENYMVKAGKEGVSCLRAKQHGFSAPAGVGSTAAVIFQSSYHSK